MTEARIDTRAAPPRSHLLALFLLAGAVLILDQITKFLASSHLEYGVPQTVFTGFDLLLAHNPGASFSFLADAGGWQRWGLSAIAFGASAFIIVWLLRLPRRQMLLGAALACILGGALGNGVDRIALGYVVDFISVYYGEWRFATFNVADIALNVGAFLIVIDILRGKSAHE
ncbi:MAG: signal peptidase II [Pseudomonadota bacterium]|nr:signal peptidase II [Pseudomonadota bacterium]